MNLLLDGGGSVKVADFGLAARSRNTTRAGAAGVGTVDRGHGILGTVAYAAPENLDDPAAPDFGRPPGDVYGVGMVAYELATGREPWVGFTIGGMLAQVLQGKRPALPEDLPPALANLIKRYHFLTEHRTQRGNRGRGS